MDVDVTQLPESRVSLKVSLTPSEVNAALDRTYKQLVQRVSIPGFRKGKAPREFLERAVGREYFLHEATDEAVRWGYRKAIEQAKVTPIDQADIDAGDEHAHIHPDETYSFEATVAVKPEVRLPDYHAIHLEREKIEVSDQDVRELLTELQQRTATLEPTVRPAQIGDVLNLNITGKIEGQEVINNESLDFELVNEEDQPDAVLPGLSAQLVGAERGDIREASLSLPELYSDQNWAGKTIFLRILVKEIKRKVLPELDDEFAQTVSQFQTLDELKDALRKNIELERSYQADEKLVTEAVDAVVGRSFVEIPPVLIDEEIDRMVDSMEASFEQARLSLRSYLDTVNKSEEDLRSEMVDEATQNVKSSLVLGAVADAEGIQVSNREIDAELEAIFRASSIDAAERRRMRQSTAVRSNLRSRLRRQRAIRRLVEIIGGQEVSSEATEAVVDQTADVADDAEETVAVEIGG